MNSVYSIVVALILFVPWAALGVTLAGYLLGRWNRRTRSA